MRFKALLLACSILVIATSKADFKDNLKTHFAQTLEFVQSEKAKRSLKIGIGGITTLGGCFFLPKAISDQASRFNKVRAITFLTSSIISGCYMLNDGLNNAPTENIKNLAQTVKMKLQPKVNEQK